MRLRAKAGGEVAGWALRSLVDGLALAGEHCLWLPYSGDAVWWPAGHPSESPGGGPCKYRPRWSRCHRNLISHGWTFQPPNPTLPALIQTREQSGYRLSYPRQSTRSHIEATDEESPRLEAAPTPSPAPHRILGPGSSGVSTVLHPGHRRTVRPGGASSLKRAKLLACLDLSVVVAYLAQ